MPSPFLPWGASTAPFNLFAKNGVIPGVVWTLGGSSGNTNPAWTAARLSTAGAVAGGQQTFSIDLSAQDSTSAVSDGITVATTSMVNPFGTLRLKLVKAAARVESRG